MKILAIDPGSTQSGYVIYDTETREVLHAGVLQNDECLRLIHRALFVDYGLVLERPTASGASMSAMAMLKRGEIESAKAQIASGYKTSGDLVTTAMWYGAFAAAADRTPDQVWNVTRQDVMRVLRIRPGAGSRDSKVRAAIIAGYPAGAERKGGALAKVKTHAWAALAVAITWDQIREK